MVGCGGDGEDWWGLLDVSRTGRGCEDGRYCVDGEVGVDGSKGEFVGGVAGDEEMEGLWDGGCCGGIVGWQDAVRRCGDGGDGKIGGGDGEMERCGGDGEIARLWRARGRAGCWWVGGLLEMVRWRDVVGMER